MSLPENSLAVHIGAEGTVSVDIQVERQILKENELLPDGLRTATLFLPEQCKLHGAWQVGLQEQIITLACTEAQLNDIALPSSMTDEITEKIAEALNAYLSEQGSCRACSNGRKGQSKFAWIKHILIGDKKTLCIYTGFIWWTLTGSNRRPSARQADALPAELNVHNSDDGNHRPNQLSYFLQRSRYSPVRVSILMRSPCSMNSGT